MLEIARIGLKVDVDTLRGTREGVPRLTALLKKHGLQATFYFSVGPDNTGRALRRVFRKGFAQKVARTSVLKHYGIRTLMYGVLLPGPHIGRQAGDVMRGVRDAGFEVGLHTFDHVRWQDYVANASASWTRDELERGVQAFRDVFGFAPTSHAAAGWQINDHGLKLEREYGFEFASDTRGRTPFWPVLPGGEGSCMQLPTTLPTFDELLGQDGVDESNIAQRVFERSQAGADAVAAGTGLPGRCAGVHPACRARRHVVARRLRRLAAALARGRRTRLRAWASCMRRFATKRCRINRCSGARVAGRSGLLAVQPPLPPRAGARAAAHA